MKKLVLFILILGVFLLLISIISKISLATCTDSDSSEYPSINYNQQGTVVSESDYLTDYCTANVLVEYYCNSADEIRAFNTVYACSEGCGDGVCKEVVENPPKGVTPPPDPGVSGTYIKGQSAGSGGGGGPETSGPAGANPSNNPSVPEQPAKDDSLLTKIAKLLLTTFTKPSTNSGIGLIIILVVLALIPLYMARKKISKKF